MHAILEKPSNLVINKIQSKTMLIKTTLKLLTLHHIIHVYIFDGQLKSCECNYVSVLHIQ